MNKKHNLVKSIMILGTALILSSCSGSKDIDANQNKYLKSVLQENENKVISTNDKLVSTDLSAISQDKKTDPENQLVIANKKLPKINENILIYDYSDLKSKDMVTAFNNRKYTLTYYFPTTNTRQTITCFENNVVITNEYYNLKYASIYKDKESYILYKDRYSKNVVTEESILKVTEFFQNLGYDSTGEITVNGNKCTYERFYNKEMHSEFMLIFDEEGNPFALKNHDIEMKIEYFSPNIDESLFELPSADKEIPEADMWTQLSTDLNISN